MTNPVEGIEFPANWKIERFKNLVTRTRHKFTGTENLLSVYLEKGVIPFNEGGADRVHNPSEDLSKYQKVNIGDFVMNNQQAWRGSVGISGYEGIVSPAYFVYKLSPLIDVEFAKHLFRSHLMVLQYDYVSGGVGTIQRNLDEDALNNVLVPVPPIEEQRRIAEYLTKQLSQIDLLIELKTSQIDQYRQLLRSEFAEMLLKSTESSIPLKRLLLDERLGVWGEEPGEGEHDVTVARVADFNRLTFRLEDATTIRSISRSQFKSRRVSKGDILLERSGGGEKSPVGCAVYVHNDFENLVSSNFVSRLRPAPNVSGRYLSLLFAALYLTGQQTPHSSQTTGIQNLDTESFFQIKVPQLNPGQQKSLTEKAEKTLLDLWHVNSRIESSIEKYHALKISIIASAVTGSLYIRESVSK